MEEQKDIVITYETLFELLKREKDRRELQKLDPHFFIEVLAYLREKKNILSAESENPNYEQTLKIQREMDNLRRIIKELYERREKKIVLMAIDQSKTKSNLIDTSVLLKEEQELYQAVGKVLDGFREGLLNNVLNEKMPQIYTTLQNMGGSSEVQQGSNESSQEDSNHDNNETTNQENNTENNGTNEIPGSESAPDTGDSDKNPNSDQTNDQKESSMVRFLHSVPRFVGPELEEYGPFVEDDIANLPAEIVHVLVQKGRVEVLQDAA